MDLRASEVYSNDISKEMNCTYWPIPNLTCVLNYMQYMYFQRPDRPMELCLQLRIASPGMTQVHPSVLRRPAISKCVESRDKNRFAEFSKEESLLRPMEGVWEWLMLC